MAKLTKKQKKIHEKIKQGQLYNLQDAYGLLQECASTKFVESVEVAINLGIDARQSNQIVRGATDLPNGTGKTVRVAVFAEGDNADAAKDAGADIVGFDDLAADIKAGNMDFDVLIATPNAMRVMAPLGKILGPRGLMPNPKVGTVTPDIANAVKKTKAGQVRYRNDKNGIIHCAIGKVNFTFEQILGNLQALMADLKKAKPSSSKGVYIKKLSLSTTMGPGLTVDLASL